ncbi:hypothetical protein DPM13_12710 [Paracoccus mutanolyticus]|uniref:Uncharacterized protein n=1 Tax=Paracoccus mutanolyticus TaxID=1499308 RepID=A0ABM6WSN9_9RHOB|nr:hypothetical protein [Paracoccus mutanolyticus]AWX93648.1 hypothetical protein DPM13_12710 [Paracoccus mutanolyticus]
MAKVTGLFIDAVRSVRSLPLLAILFTAAVVLPFALPEVLIGQKLYRVILAPIRPRSSEPSHPARSQASDTTRHLFFSNHVSSLTTRPQLPYCCA